MKKIRNLVIVVGTILVLPLFFTAIALALYPESPAITHTGNMYLTPNSSNIAKGATVKTTIRITPGTNIDTVTAALSYDESELSYGSVSYSGSAFPTQIPLTHSAGSVTIQSAKLGNVVDTDSLVAVVSFTAKKDGTSQPTLYGNAARAGVATNPTIDGRIVNPPSTTSTCTTNCTSNAGVKTESSATASTKKTPIAALQNLLLSLGVNQQTAKQIYPWVTAATVVILISSAITALLLHKRIRHAVSVHANQVPVNKPQDHTEEPHL